jgi:hypothetical protein
MKYTGKTRSEFCLSLAIRALKYLESGSAWGSKLHDYLSIDFDFYGGKRIFGPDDKEVIITGAIKFAYDQSKMTLPE